MAASAAGVASVPLLVLPEGEDPLVELCATLLAENDRLQVEVERRDGQIERLKARVGKLTVLVEELRRAGKRQAAPFSRGKREEKPKRPGRRSGERYGIKARRSAPEEVDETVQALTADRCECGGEIVFERTEQQWQEELPEPKPIRRLIEVHIGRCRCCGKRHQGRHPYQTSDALGAAACMLGARAVALATVLNKELGLSPQKTSKLLLQFGIRITPGGVVGAIARQAKRLEPTYGALVVAVRASRAVAPDETGWRVAARKQWLWAFVGELVTVYLIGSRGSVDAKRVLGEDFSGVLERDGWLAYRPFTTARHQTCLGHLLKRCRELIDDAIAGQARIPHATRMLLKDALALRERYAWLLAGEYELSAEILAALASEPVDEEVIDAEVVEEELIDVGNISRPPLALPAGEAPMAVALADARPADGDQAAPSPAAHDAIDAAPVADEPAGALPIDAARQLAAERAKLEARLDRLLARNPTHEPNRLLLAHLRNERDHILTFLKIPGVQATNWRAEQAVRPAVLNRKSWGGNRTWQGARTQEVTMSVIRTARQQQVDPVELMAQVQLQRTPTVTDQLKLPTARSDPAPAIAA